MRNLVLSAVVASALTLPFVGTRADASVTTQASEAAASSLMGSPQYVYAQPGGYYPAPAYPYAPGYYYGPSYYGAAYPAYYGPRIGGGVYFGFGGRWGGWRRR
jgi:hypothetical protein